MSLYVEDSKTRIETILEAIREKKATNLVLIDLKKLKNAVADYFIVCTGNTDRQTQAIADSVEEYAKKFLNDRPLHREGYGTGEWILLDFVDIVVHIFMPDPRQFYRLEELWGDGKITHFEDEN